MIVIKRYPNRKLYDTEAKQYITLDGIAKLIREGNEIRVIDHPSGEDLTAVTLTQIILEQERKQTGYLSNSFLTGLIRSSGDRLAALQKNLRSSQSIWRQMDEEIQNRIQALVHAGELTAREGQGMLEKLLSQTARMDNRRSADQWIENYLRKRQVPSKDEIETLNEHLDQMFAALDKMIQETSLDD